MIPFEDLVEANLSDALDTIMSLKISSAERATLLGNLILEWGGRTKRTFGIQTDFEPVDPACTSGFDRTFAHQDWIDGTSVVQAEQTSLEDGFNVRFHAIEGDLDSLGAELAKAFLCIADLRAGMASVLDELETEINRINADVAECCYDAPGPRPLPGGQMELLGKAHFAGYARLFDQEVAVWQTSQGLVTLPLLKDVDPAPVYEGVTRAGEAAGFLLDDGRVGEFMAARRGVDKAALIDEFGDEVLPGGGLLRHALLVLPVNRTYGTPGEVVDDLAQTEAAAIRARPGGQAAVASRLGVAGAAEPPQAAPIEAMTEVPLAARRALRSAGMESVGSLAGTDVATVHEVLGKAGVTASNADVVNWVTSAQVISLIE